MLIGDEMERRNRRVLESVVNGLNGVLVDLEELRIDYGSELDDPSFEPELNCIMRKVSLANVDLMALSKIIAPAKIRA
jgi:hypothetical protein